MSRDRTKENTERTDFERLTEVVRKLRSPEGCPWDRAQTHETLKAPCVEEAAEVVCGINILSATGRAENLKEELGDLLLQVVFHAEIAEEEGLFTMNDVIDGICGKMIRRHPHVFAGAAGEGADRKSWEEVKKQEKEGREWETEYLAEAFDEADRLIDAARKRKGIRTES